MSAPRVIYPIPETPRQESRFKVSHIHELYLAEYGNPDGIPVMVVHGGPGSGCRPFLAGYFDPQKYRILLLDQRGAGQSTPRGCMEENTTQLLIADMEVVRNALKIDKWLVCGGSWGSTLGLLYAETHPDRVLGLILRGIWLGRDHDITAFLCDRSMAATVHPTEWKAFKSSLKQLLQQSGLVCSTMENDDHYIIDANYILLTEGSAEVKAQAAGLLCQWEKRNTYLEPTEEDLKWSSTPDGVNMGLTETIYMKNKCFIAPNQILDNLAKIAHLQLYIIQGKYDMVCPRNQSVELEMAHRANQGNVIRYDSVSGHAGNEPGNVNGMVLAADHFAANYKLEKAQRVAGCYNATFSAKKTVLTDVGSGGYGKRI